MDAAAGTLNEKAMKYFFIRFNLFTEGFSFFVVVPFALFYVWSSIQLTPEQMATFNVIWPPSFLFGITFVLANNWIVVLPVMRYFRKLRNGVEVTDVEYRRAKKRFLRLPIIHATGAFFRWILLLGNAIVAFTLLSDATRPQIINMWMGTGLCAILGVASYFSITEIMLQDLLNKGIFQEKTEDDNPPRINLQRRLTMMSISSVLLTLALLVTFFYITVENNHIADTLIYIRIAAIALLSIIVGIFSPIIMNRTLRDKIHIVVEFLKQIGGGDLNGHARAVPINDEISEIIFDVDDMKNRLRTARDELVDLNLNLERKVADRTEELEAAMSELEAMNDNLIRVNGELEVTEEVRKKDMSLAASVQAAFLPRKPPAYKSYDIAFTYNPWSEVSGDFFDFYESDGELKGAGIFDVSGHGISSGLLTLLAKSIISRHFYFEKDLRLSVIVENINREMIDEIGQIDNYVTGILLRFMDDRVEYVNSAHPDIIFRSGVSGKVGMIMDKPGVESKALFLGVAGMSHSFPSLSLKLGSGDCLLLYTDCMHECQNSRGESFGEAGIMESLRNAPGGTAREMMDHVMRDFNAFHGSISLKDDLTAIIIKRK